MIEREIAEMRIYKPDAVTRRSQLLPPHIPRQMPAIQTRPIMMIENNPI
jgi:hypothetical protein